MMRPIRVSQRVILGPILGSEWDISDNFGQHLVENLVQRTSTRPRKLELGSKLELEPAPEPELQALEYQA